MKRRISKKLIMECAAKYPDISLDITEHWANECDGEILDFPDNADVFSEAECKNYLIRYSWTEPVEE